MENRSQRTSILFPGQGSQYPGMCRQLINDFPCAAEVFKEASDILSDNIISIVLNGSMEELTASENAQPIMVTASCAFFHVFQFETGLTPISVAGHSLGEISALACVNALSFSDAIRYSKERGKLMQNVAEARIGRAGLVVDLNIDVLTEIVESTKKKHYVSISGFNSPNQFIVAGTNAGISDLGKHVDDSGGEFIPFKMIPMKVDAPYHTELMEPSLSSLRHLLDQIFFKEPEINMWSTVTGQLIKSAQEIPKILMDQLIFPVQWNQVLKTMYNSGTDLFIDIGPNQIIRNLLRENSELPISLSFDDEKDINEIYQHILGKPYVNKNKTN